MRPPRLNPLQAVRKMLGRDDLPNGFVGRLDADERVLASAAMPGDAHCLATSYGIWIPGEDGPRRIGWHLVSKAIWKDGAIRLTEAHEVEDVGGAVLIVDKDMQIVRLTEPGRVPEIVQERVTSSIRTRHHRDLPGGGAWFVQRKVAGRDGYVLQVRPDPGTDPDAVRQLAVDVAAGLGLR